MCCRTILWSHKGDWLLRLDVCLGSRTFVSSSEHVERATAQLVAYHEAFLSVTERLLV